MNISSFSFLTLTLVGIYDTRFKYSNHFAQYNYECDLL